MKKRNIVWLFWALIVFGCCGEEEEPVAEPEEVYPHQCAENVPVYPFLITPKREIYYMRLNGNHMVSYLEPGGKPIEAYAGDVIRIRVDGSVYMFKKPSGEEYWGNPEFHMFMKYGSAPPHWIGRFNELPVVTFPFEIAREIVFYVLELPPIFLCTAGVEEWYANNRGYYDVEITIQRYQD